jgi:RND family efflux transporter MFP subunit
MRKSAAALSLTALMFMAACGRNERKPEPAAVPVKAEAVATQAVRPSWRYSGEIRPDKQVQLAFREPGYVAALHSTRGADGRVRDVQVGDQIPAGTVLARLRLSDYEASLSSAAGQENSMKGALGASQAELENAKAEQSKADLDFERAQALYSAKAMTRPDYDAAVTRHASTMAGVQAAMQQIAARQGQLHAAQAQLVSARIGVNDTNLIAPMPGVIVEKSVERGSLVAAGTPAFTLDDTRVVKVAFGVPDTMLAHFKLGAALPVQIQALELTLTGRVTQIAAAANRDSRVFNIEVTLANADRCLKEGMIATVAVEEQSGQPVPVVPLSALITAQSGTNSYSLFIVREREGQQYAQLKGVRLGETIGNSVVIEAGVNPGERIIVNRTNQLNDGSLIRVVE